MKTAQVFETNMRSLVPTLKDMKDSAWPIFRGTFLGFFLGLIPGVGAVDEIRTRVLAALGA